MIRKATAILASVVVLAGLAAYAGSPPVMTTQYVSTFQGVPVSFTLRAEDAGIDPAHPEAFPLTFLILEGPAHGILTGDLGKVRYVDPHWALVDLTYTASASFVGVDTLTVAVLDPVGEIGRVVSTVEITVQKKPALGSLSGNWEVSASLNVQSMSLTSFRTRLTEVYQLGKLVLQGVAEWRTVGSPAALAFDALRFEARFPVATFAQVTSVLAFDPNTTSVSGPFDYWRLATRVAAFGTSATHTLYLARSGSISYQTLVLSASVGDVSVTSTTRLDLRDCAFCFKREDVYAVWTWCDLAVSASLSMTESGFEQWSMRLADLPIPGLVGADLGLYLTTQVQFTLTQKRVLPMLEVQSAWLDCLQVLVDLQTGVSSNAIVDSVSFYGFRIRHSFPDGIEFQSATSLDPARNATLTGYSDYFELITLSGTTVPCCQAPGLWRLATYFQSAQPSPFGWGMTKFFFDIGVGEGLRASAEVVIRSGSFPGDPLVELTVGCVVRW